MHRYTSMNSLTMHLLYPPLHFIGGKYQFEVIPFRGNGIELVRVSSYPLGVL